MTKRWAYGKLGAVGVLTPSGNPTVEPECARLLGDDVLMLTARMYDPAPDLLDRLVAYANRVDGYIASFGGVPLSTFLFACTGSCYLIGPEAETRIVERFKASGVTFVTAAHAIRAMLADVSARRIVVVNPYPQNLAAASFDYWRAVGFDVVHVVDVENPEPGYHAIYTLTDDLVANALVKAEKIAADLSADAILCTGTGMATLPAVNGVGAARPVFSSNIALAWMGRKMLGDPVTAREWLGGEAPWRRRL